MSDFCGMVRKEEGYLDVLDSETLKVYKYKGEIYIVAYDGDICNKDEIREELIARGDYFNTDEEEEIVLKCYLAFGEEAFNNFEGVFSVGIYNVDDKKLILARDPIGAKSMFFSIVKDDVIFSNNVGNIVKSRYVKPEVTYEGIAELMTLGPSRRQNSAIFRNINQLEPGSFLEFNYPNVAVKKYADFEAFSLNESFEDTVENVREMLVDSILKQYPKDQDVCALLSGGLDSSIVTTVVADVAKEEGNILKTFSVDYEGNETFFKANDFQPNSDGEWIKKMVEFLDIDHTNIRLSSEELVDSLNTAMIARGFPGMGDIDTSLLRFCDKMSERADIGMGGECADEVFGGYPWFHRPALIESDFFPWIRSVTERGEFVNKEIKHNVDIVKFAKDIYSDELKKVPILEGETEKEKRIREIGYLTYRWFLPVLLERQDKMATKANFKIRAPFCNFKLMKYVYNIPWEYRVKGDMEKGLLRTAFKDLLPSEVVERKKSPYPKTFNPKYKELVTRELSHIIENPTSPILDVIDLDNVKRLMYEEETANRPWFGQLMRGPQVMAFLIQVNGWMKEFRVSIV